MAKLLDVRRVQSNNPRSLSYYFVATFDSQPTLSEVTSAQIQAGYHPAGYGGPWGIKYIQEGINIVAAFHCMNNCD